MPELPEVETMRRGVMPIVGQTIEDVRRVAVRLRPILIQPRVDAFRRRCLGRRIVEVGRLGKRVLVRLDSDDTIVFEPRMTGLVLLADPPNREHLRMEFSLGGGSSPQLLYWDRRGLGNVRLFSPDELRRQWGEGRLGPDALEISAEQLRDALRRRRRPVKVALLDQAIVAGIGNLYASEILHVAEIHPAARCDRLTRAHWQRIHAATQHVLQEAIHYEGSTLSDGTYRNALNQAGGYQNHHRVYDLAGQRCRRCELGVIQRIVQAQRATFFCPHCQRR